MTKPQFFHFAHRRTTPHKTPNPCTTGSCVSNPMCLHTFCVQYGAFRRRTNYSPLTNWQPKATPLGLPQSTTKRWVQKLADCIVPLKDTPHNTSSTRIRHSMALSRDTDSTTDTDNTLSTQNGLPDPQKCLRPTFCFTTVPQVVETTM